MHMMDTHNTSICTNALTGCLSIKVYNIILIIYVHNKGVKFLHFECITSVTTACVQYMLKDLTLD